MSTNDLSAYKPLYIQTAKEYLQNLRSDFLLWKEKPEDEEVISRLHISSHSLKGQSLAMNYNNTGLLCKELEYFFRDTLEKKININSATLSIIDTILDHLEQCIQTIETENKECDLSSEVVTLQSIERVL